MRKFLIILFVLWSSIGLTHANRDRVSNVQYGAIVDLNINAQVEVIDNSCGDSISQQYYGNITSNLNVVGSSICAFRDGKLDCQMTKSTSGGVEQTISTNIKLCSTKRDIFSSLYIPSYLTYNNSGNFCVSYKIQMDLLTDSNGRPHRDRKSELSNRKTYNFPSIEFEDSSYCEPDCSQEDPNNNPDYCGRVSNPTYDSTDIILDPVVLDTSKVAPEISVTLGSNSDNSGNTNNNSNINNSNNNSGNGNGSNNPSAQASVSGDGEGECQLIGNTYYCYTTTSLPISVSVINPGNNPAGITNIRVAVLNAGRTNRITSDEIFSAGAGDSFNIDYLGDGKFKKVEQYTLEIEGYNDSGNQWNSTGPVYVNVEFVPNPYGLKAEITGEDGANNFGNYRDTFGYDFNLTDKYNNVINSKTITNLICEGGIGVCSSIKEVNQKKSIIANGFGSLNANGDGNFEIKSAVPGTFTPIFKGTLKKWDTRYTDTSETVEFLLNNSGQKIFKDPITWNELRVEGGGVSLSTSQKYEILLNNDGYLNNISNGKVLTTGESSLNLSSFKLDQSFIFENGLESIQNLVRVNGSNSSATLNPYFYATVKSLSDNEFLDNIELHPQNLSIDYGLFADTDYHINYDLNVSDANICSDRNKLGVKIEGFSQGVGKVSDTGSESNYTDISQTSFRSKIRKNAYLLARGLSSGTSVNKIHYFEGDYTLDSTELLSYNINDTLIVRDGNLTITSNIDNNIGIIVLSDGYDVTDSSSKGNILIEKSVNTINAFIYADGGIMTLGSPDDINNRETLDIVGSIFTRNTIGGGEIGDSQCYLPGDKKTSNCILAKKYDLNMLRKKIICDENDYSLKIIYNPMIKTNPPKGFEN